MQRFVPRAYLVMCYALNVSVKYGCCVCVCDVFGWQEISLFVLDEHVFG
jgi:hypothetical protein